MKIKASRNSYFVKRYDYDERELAPMPPNTVCIDSDADIAACGVAMIFQSPEVAMSQIPHVAIKELVRQTMQVYRRYGKDRAYAQFGTETAWTTSVGQPSGHLKQPVYCFVHKVGELILVALCHETPGEMQWARNKTHYPACSSERQN